MPLTHLCPTRLDHHYSHTDLFSLLSQQRCTFATGWFGPISAHSIIVCISIRTLYIIFFCPFSLWNALEMNIRLCHFDLVSLQCWPLLQAIVPSIHSYTLLWVAKAWWGRKWLSDKPHACTHTHTHTRTHTETHTASWSSQKKDSRLPVLKPHL